MTISKRKPGRPMSHQERAARTGRVLFQAYLEPEDAETLDAVAAEEGNRTAALHRILREERIRRDRRARSKK